MEDIAQNAYYPGAADGYTHQAYYMNTPSPQQSSILSSNTYASQQLTPQTDHSDYHNNRFASEAQLSRSNSESFIFQPHVGSTIAPAVGGGHHLHHHARLPISHHAYRSSSGDDGKPKNKRTQCACENCRNKKSKCDGGQPCQGCKEAKVDCKYREIPPSKKDNAMNELLELMQTHNQEIRRLVDRIEEIDVRLRRVEQRTDQRACWQCGTSQYPVF